MPRLSLFSLSTISFFFQQVSFLQFRYRRFLRSWHMHNHNSLPWRQLKAVLPDVRNNPPMSGFWGSKKQVRILGRILLLLRIFLHFIRILSIFCEFYEENTHQDSGGVNTWLSSLVPDFKNFYLATLSSQHCRYLQPTAVRRTAKCRCRTADWKCAFDAILSINSL